MLLADGEKVPTICDRCGGSHRVLVIVNNTQQLCGFCYNAKNEIEEEKK